MWIEWQPKKREKTKNGKNDGWSCARTRLWTLCFFGCKTHWHTHTDLQTRQMVSYSVVCWLSPPILFFSYLVFSFHCSENVQELQYAVVAITRNEFVRSSSEKERNERESAEKRKAATDRTDDDNVADDRRQNFTTALMATVKFDRMKARKNNILRLCALFSRVLRNSVKSPARNERERKKKNKTHGKIAKSDEKKKRRTATAHIDLLRLCNNVKFIDSLAKIKHSLRRSTRERNEMHCDHTVSDNRPRSFCAAINGTVEMNGGQRFFVSLFRSQRFTIFFFFSRSASIKVFFFFAKCFQLILFSRFCVSTRPFLFSFSWMKLRRSPHWQERKKNANAKTMKL